MHPGVTGRAHSAQGQRLVDAIAAVRRRRPYTTADVLLEECLSLLEELRDCCTSVEFRCAGRRMNGRESATDGRITMVDGDSPAIARLKQEIRCVARDPYVSVLIRGESGTGKERVARAIHDGSSRAAGPFVVVNCAGLAPALAEDELFGHVRGAFTGAAADRPSPFECANGGTVFLDEIGELTLEAQTKLLRALQERTVHRLGGTRDIQFDARIVAATNADLEEAQRRGRFRQDLYYRLKVFELVVPPLRCRGEADLQQLVDAILSSLSAQRGRTMPTLSSDAWETFTKYAWPGNVRELHNTLERMIVAGGGADVLTALDVPHDVRRATRSARVCSRASRSGAGSSVAASVGDRSAGGSSTASRAARKSRGCARHLAPSTLSLAETRRPGRTRRRRVTSRSAARWRCRRAARFATARRAVSHARAMIGTAGRPCAKSRQAAVVIVSSAPK